MDAQAGAFGDLPDAQAWVRFWHGSRLGLDLEPATASGSFYALWKHDSGTDLARLPVIFCGDDGELYIAARDLPELLRLLAAEDEGEPAHGAYVAWLRRTLGLTPVEDPAAIYQAALVEYGRAFADWWLTFDDEDSIIADLLDELEECNL
ncbi:hypothetical protein ABGB18_35615 [Nonomuraea sp. B12E4]|uniref:hypothetical protein n=1 Tax=Nonomuraea sp. B12E4 TaxID=3153564 RepID=UPI00325DD370